MPVAAARRIMRPYSLEVKEIAWWSVYEIGQRITDVGTEGLPDTYEKPVHRLDFVAARGAFGVPTLTILHSLVEMGRKLGFPTANIRIKHNPLPMTGVFAVAVDGLGPEPLPGVANLGIRPTVGGTRPLLEVHLFNFNRDIYGAHIAVRFLQKLRDEQRFPNFDALKAQIAADAAAARAFFKL